MTAIAGLRRRQRASGGRKGRCTRCLKPHPSKRFLLCLKCRKELRTKRRRRERAGVCVNCPSRPDSGYVTCRSCIAKHAAAVVVRRRRLRRSGLCVRCGKRRDGKWLNCTTCRLHMRRIRQRSDSRMRHALLSRLGGRCSCCHETESRFLTLDHRRNDGYKDRRVCENPYPLYKKILRGRVKVERFQLLCWNCNLGKAHNGGVCPHRSSRRARGPAPRKAPGRRPAAAS